MAQIKKTLALDSNYAEAHFTLGMTYHKTNDYEKSVTELKKAVSLSNRRPVILSWLGAMYANQGKTEEAKKLLAELELPPVNNDKLYAIAVIKSALGQSAEALTIRDKLVDEKYGLMIYIKAQKYFFQDYDNPRYQRMLKKMNLE